MARRRTDSGLERETTWAALLAKWTEFARAAVALPETGEGGRWRSAVAPIIGLQAVTHALADLGTLDVSERAAGADRAEILIRRHAVELHELWRGEPLPELVRELIDDARAALVAAREGGIEWFVSSPEYVGEHPGELGAALVAAGFGGELYLPAPGVPLFEGSVAGFARGHEGGHPGEDVAEAVESFLFSGAGAVRGPDAAPRARQVYRRFDFGVGCAVHDAVVPMDADLPSGQPLLVPVVLGGEVQAVSLPPRTGVRQGPLPVVFEH